MSSDPTPYYDRATSWALDEQAKTEAALRHARWFSAMAILIAVLEAFALLLLTPLKSVQLTPILVDRQTGFVEVLNPDGRREIQADAALTQSLLAQYVIAREGFDITQLAHDYRKVSLWSAGAARQDYLASVAASNPRSPLRALPRSAMVDVQIKSISPLARNTALVRFRTTRRDQSDAATVVHNWAAVATYRFSDAPMAFEDRLNNPLGFQVSRYHKDAETLSPPDPPSPTAATITAPAPVYPSVNVAPAVGPPANPVAPVGNPPPGPIGPLGAKLHP